MISAETMKTRFCFWLNHPSNRQERLMIETTLTYRTSGKQIKLEMQEIRALTLIYSEMVLFNLFSNTQTLDFKLQMQNNIVEQLWVDIALKIGIWIHKMQLESTPLRSLSDWMPFPTSTMTVFRNRQGWISILEMIVPISSTHLMINEGFLLLSDKV